jgi:hypothetical protein
MARDLRFLPPIPEGMRILAGDEEVAGVNHRLANAKRFAKGRKHELSFEREPHNNHDPNAIKVVGIFQGWFFTHQVHIGYVSATLAKVIAERNLFAQIRPRLKNIWLGGRVRDFIVVRFDIVEPKPAREARNAKLKAGAQKPKSSRETP